MNTFQNIWRRDNNCPKGKHRLKTNAFGITWCIDCGVLSTKPSADTLESFKKII